MQLQLNTIIYNFWHLSMIANANLNLLMKQATYKVAEGEGQQRLRKQTISLDLLHLRINVIKN